MGSFQRLTAWQKAMDLVDSVYRASRGFPKAEMFGLTSQMRSAAISIPLNIAEGSGRFTPRDQIHFLRQSRGSIHELQTTIEISVRLSFLTPGDGKLLMDRADEVGRLVNGLIKSLGTRD